MVDDQYLFELPVYVLAPAEFDRLFEETLNREAERLFEQSGGNWPGKDRAWFVRFVEQDRSSALRGFGGPWRYNQVCGFLGIFPLGDQLRGDLWLQDRRILRATKRRRRIEFRHKAFELTIRPDASSEDILSALLREIKAVHKRAPLRGRFVDTQALQLVGAFVNWRRLLDVSKANGLAGLRLSQQPDGS